MKAKSAIYLIMAILPFFWTSCSNEFSDLAKQAPTNQEMLQPRSFDYSSYKLLEKRNVFPRTGESYHDRVEVNDCSFPLHIYWDFDFQNYNLYAYIEGVDGHLWGSGHYMAHVATYESECSASRFDFVIKCNRFDGHLNSSGYVTGPYSNPKHVSFHVTFFPREQRCMVDVLEFKDGLWEPEI